MEFDILVENRQSCRDFIEKPIELEKLKKVAKNALLAPSACNSQPWKIYIIADKEKVKAVAKSSQDFGMNKFASKAQAFFVVTEITATLAIGASIKFDRNHFVKYDVGELVAYLTLTAKNEGLDTCILGWLNHDNLKEVVGFSDDEFCAMIIAVGYSETPLRKKIRKSFDEKVTII